MRLVGGTVRKRADVGVVVRDLHVVIDEGAGGPNQPVARRSHVLDATVVGSDDRAVDAFVSDRGGVGQREVHRLRTPDAAPIRAPSEKHVGGGHTVRVVNVHSERLVFRERARAANADPVPLFIVLEEGRVCRIRERERLGEDVDDSSDERRHGAVEATEGHVVDEVPDTAVLTPAAGSGRAHVDELPRDLDRVDVRPQETCKILRLVDDPVAAAARQEAVEVVPRGPPGARVVRADDGVRVVQPTVFVLERVVLDESTRPAGDRDRRRDESEVKAVRPGRDRTLLRGPEPVVGEGARVSLAGVDGIVDELPPVVGGRGRVGPVGPARSGNGRPRAVTV
jgi:hypothetical protein